MLLRPLLVVLAYFSLAFSVLPGQTQEVRLTWDAPLQSNGVLFPGLAGYKLYYGSSSGTYQTVISVGPETTYTVPHMSPGQTYYFTVTAVTRTGGESAFSKELSFTVPATLPAEPSTNTPALKSSAPATPAPAAPTTSLTPSDTNLHQQPDVASGVSSVPATARLSPSTVIATQHTRWEMTLTSTKTYANPFADVTVRVEYTQDGSPPMQGYAFWDGGSTFKLRQAFPTPGTWHYTTTATDPADSGLHNRTGEIEVLPYTGSNALYRHGFLQVSPDRRFLIHADGTPFLWLSDTLWGATVWLTEAGFHEAVADRRAKHFTVLQTNFARKAEVDTVGDTPWHGDRWNVRFMQKLDRMFDDANDQGMYLFVNALVDLLWDRGIPHYERLVEMIAIRYAAHYVSFASSMHDPYDPVHERINTAIRRVAPHHLLTQQPGAARNGQGHVWTAERYYDTSSVDYVMDATSGAGDLEMASRNAIAWSLRLYTHRPPKPVINGEAWYEGEQGGTAEIAAHLGYLSLLSGNSGYAYGTSLWNAKDIDLPAWKAFRGAIYMQYLYDFFLGLDEGRPLQPRHELITNQPTHHQRRMVLGVSNDGRTYAAFLPQGGTITIDLTALTGPVEVTWYNPLTGQYRSQGTALAGAVQSFVSPFTGQSALILHVQ